jgi:RsiW-degrading membrane proteinase PrsW (M82 family)
VVFLEVLWGYLPFLGLFVDGVLKQSRLRHIPLFEMFKGGNESSPQFVRLLTREKIAVFEQLICDLVAFHRSTQDFSRILWFYLPEFIILLSLLTLFSKRSSAPQNVLS